MNGKRTCRESLRRMLLSGFLLAVSISGCLPRESEEGDSGRSGRMTSGTKYVVMWNKHHKVKHLVIIPQYASSHVVSGPGKKPGPPSATGITSYSNGLYLNGTKINTSTHSVFVFTVDQAMVPVVLTEDELAQLGPNAIRTACELQFWKEKISEKIEMESKRWRGQ